MFWKNKEEAQQTAEKPSAEKPCCSEKKKAGEANQPASPAPQQQQSSAGISTFEFGGNVASGIKLVGHCQGTDPNSIQACQWKPSIDSKHTILF